MADYTYNVANDTLNGQLAENKLEREIQASSITIAQDGITTSNGEVTISFKIAISTAEETELTAVVAAHDGVREVDDTQKFRIVGANDVPVGVVDDAGVQRLALDLSTVLTGPQGPQGDQGPQGEQGPAGTGSIFGSEYQYAESESQSSTTSGSYQQKLRLTTSNLPAGDYRIAWAAEVDTTDSDMNVRIQLDDSTIINEFEYGVDADDGGDPEWSALGSFKTLTLSGVHTIDIDYNDDGGGTAYIRKARIEIWRVS